MHKPEETRHNAHPPEPGHGHSHADEPRGGAHGHIHGTVDPTILATARGIWGRVEDLAGVAIVLTILASAIAAGYESVYRFFHPQTVTYLWAVVVAS